MFLKRNRGVGERSSSIHEAFCIENIRYTYKSNDSLFIYLTSILTFINKISNRDKFVKFRIFETFLSNNFIVVHFVLFFIILIIFDYGRFEIHEIKSFLIERILYPLILYFSWPSFEEVRITEEVRLHIAESRNFLVQPFFIYRFYIFPDLVFENSDSQKPGFKFCTFRSFCISAC